MLSARQLRERRKKRVHAAIRNKARGRPRLTVFRSNQHIYAQVVDDAQGHTLAAASTLDRELRAELARGSDVTAAAEVGKLVAQRATEAGVDQVAFDRSGYKYHGRVRALAEAARDGGLSF